MTVNCHTIHNSKSCWRYHFSWKRICALKTEISPSLAPSSPLRAFPISTMLSQRKERGVWVGGCNARFSLYFFRHEICQKNYTARFSGQRFYTFNFNSFSGKTSQELRMLSRSLSDCKSLLLNVMIQVSQFIRNGQLCHLFTKSLLI